MSQKNEGGCFTRQKHLFDLRSLHTELFVRLTSSGMVRHVNAMIPNFYIIKL